MRLRTLVPLVLALCATTAAFAQPPASGYRFELTPTVSWRFGGELDGRDLAFVRADLEADDSAAYGLTLDIPLSRSLQLELLAHRQRTDLGFDEGLFGPDLRFAKMDVSYYHVGVLFQGHSGRVSPFFVLSGGIGVLDPKLPGARSETRASVSLGGGVKVFFDDAEHIGLRFEGRGFWTDIGDDYGWDCGYHGHYRRCDYDDDFSQGQVSLGLAPYS
ncbi:MAG TPA: hypothetical protein PKO05_07900, partial [Thermoanaerobaculia bacterium]|nr:hypothetical protein [Thermoanaerobaculia bacterium]